MLLAPVARRDPRVLVAAINDERLTFLKHLSTWPVFGAGWSRRVSEVRSISLRMAAQTRPTPSVVTDTAPVPGKGSVPTPVNPRRR